MKNKEIVSDWIKRARSNLERARTGKCSEEILYEDICFDAQQAAEKSLKALLVKLDKPFPKTHSIGSLLKLIEETGIEIPGDVKQSKILTDYAVDARYPGVYEPVSEDEYEEALKLAEDVFLMDNQDGYVRWGIMLIAMSETTGSFFNQLRRYL